MNFSLPLFRGIRILSRGFARMSESAPAGISAASVASSASSASTLKRASSPSAPSAKKLNSRRRKYKEKPYDATGHYGVLLRDIRTLLERENSNRIDKPQIHWADIENDVEAVLNRDIDVSRFHGEFRSIQIATVNGNGDGLAVVFHNAEVYKRESLEPPAYEQAALQKFGGVKPVVVVVPFAVAGDIVDIQLVSTYPRHVTARILAIVTPSPQLRHYAVPGVPGAEKSQGTPPRELCRYFGECGGCQFQMMEYKEQLRLKRDTIVNAYRYFAQLPGPLAGEITEKVAQTVASPKIYEYRTKLTPHFDIPRRLQKKGAVGAEKNALPAAPPIGFMHKHTGHVMDIEDCIIGTPAVRRQMAVERQRVQKEFRSFRRGATILLREDSMPKSEAEGEAEAEAEAEEGIVKRAVTDQKQLVTEYVGEYKFRFPAGSFFQNNNSILPVVAAHVVEHLVQPNCATAAEIIPIDSEKRSAVARGDLKLDIPTYVLDTYCGSGFFGIMCAAHVHRTIGIELSWDSVRFAEDNARQNNLENVKYHVGDSEKIFGTLKKFDVLKQPIIDSEDGLKFDLTTLENGDEEYVDNNYTTVIVDPPRKGCDHAFLRQLSEFSAKRIVYISCNVNSQARDLGYFFNELGNAEEYRVVSLRGFDFFPQTYHVESVLVLERIN